MRVYTLATSGFCLLYFPFRSISPCSRFLSPAPQEDRSTMIQGTIHNIFVKGGRLFHVCFALRKLGVADVCVLDVLLVYFTLLYPFQLIICYCVGRFRPTAPRFSFNATQYISRWAFCTCMCLFGVANCNCVYTCAFMEIAVVWPGQVPKGTVLF